MVLYSAVPTARDTTSKPTISTLACLPTRLGNSSTGLPDVWTPLGIEENTAPYHAVSQHAATAAARNASPYVPSSLGATDLMTSHRVRLGTASALLSRRRRRQRRRYTAREYLLRPARVRRYGTAGCPVVAGTALTRTPSCSCPWGAQVWTGAPGPWRPGSFHSPTARRPSKPRPPLTALGPRGARRELRASLGHGAPRGREIQLRPAFLRSAPPPGAPRG